MKVISLWQPWASLVALGAKEYETRSWTTTHRGPLAIHAAKTNAESSYFYRKPFFDVFQAHSIAKFNDLPFGMIICIVDLIAIYQTEKLYPNRRKHLVIMMLVEPRGGWQMLRISPPPIAVRGQQGLWEWSRP